MSSASDLAYGRIREMLLSGEFAPLTQLKEEELAEICGVSRTPIRDALRRLEAESLVRRTDTQRTFVPDWSTDEVEDIFTLRALLESHAAARAARFITAEEIEALRGYNRLIDRAINGSHGLDSEAFVTNNRHFHHTMLVAAKSERLVKMCGMIVEQSVLHRTARNYNAVGLRRSHTDHEELVAAFELHDAEWARSIMTSHIRRAYHVTAGTGVNDAGEDAEAVMPESASRRRKLVALG